jgi:hypothetical protein
MKNGSKPPLQVNILEHRGQADNFDLRSGQEHAERENVINLISNIGMQKELSSGMPDSLALFSSPG